MDQSFRTIEKRQYKQAGLQAGRERHVISTQQNHSPIFTNIVPIAKQTFRSLKEEEKSLTVSKYLTLEIGGDQSCSLGEAWTTPSQEVQQPSDHSTTTSTSNLYKLSIYCFNTQADISLDVVFLFCLCICRKKQQISNIK